MSAGDNNVASYLSWHCGHPFIAAEVILGSVGNFWVPGGTAVNCPIDGLHSKPGTILQLSCLSFSLTPGFPLLSVGQGTEPFAEEWSHVLLCSVLTCLQEPEQLSGCCRRIGRAVGQGCGEDCGTSYLSCPQGGSSECRIKASVRWTPQKREMSSAALSVPEQGAVGPGTSAKPAVGTARKECHHCLLGWHC